jgi:ABC-type multidrug transport system fused ATPase/permease subunit
VIVVLVVLAILIGLGYLMYTSYDRAAGAGVVPGTVRLRDIAFIVIAAETLIAMVLVIIIVVLLVVIVVLIYDRLIPILEQLNKSISTVNESLATVLETVHTVRGTTTFVGEKVVAPVIEASSYASGAARIVKGILDLWPGNKSQPSQEERSPVVDESSVTDL